jgi:hypothetical protein
MHENAHQHRVLDHIGEIAGVKGVAIIHGRKVMGAKSCAQIRGCQSRQAAVARTRRLLTPGAGRRVPVTDPALRCLVRALLR